MSNPRSTLLVVLVCASVLAGLAAAPYILAQPNPSGAPVPAAALDANLVRDESYGALSFEGLSYVVATTNASAAPGGNLLYGVAYDVTFTNITNQAPMGYGYGYGYSGSLTGLRLCGPNDASLANPRDLYADGEHVGRFNVTFPSATLGDTGVWTLYFGVTTPSACSATGTPVAFFLVRPVADLAVTVTPSVVEHGPGSASYTVTVSNAGGAPVRLAGPNIPPGATTGPSGQYSAFGPRPAPGTYAVLAELDQTGGPIPERTGSATVTFATPVARIAAPNVSGGMLLPVTRPITIQNVTALGSLTLNLTFDPAVVEIVGVANGTVPGGELTWSLNNSTGTLRLLVTNPARPGPSGDFAVANVSFKAKGALGATTTLHLDAIELVDSEGAPIPFVTVDGRFRAGLLGDVNADSSVNQADLTALSQYVVGALPGAGLALANADTNQDGQVTGVDALFLSQHLAGTRPELE